MLSAAEPTATISSLLLSTATTEGSERTIPCPLTNISVFAVPKSIATSNRDMDRLANTPTSTLLGFDP
jgi:hypothetical protein